MPTHRQDKVDRARLHGAGEEGERLIGDGPHVRRALLEEADRSVDEHVDGLGLLLLLSLVLCVLLVFRILLRLGSVV